MNSSATSSSNNKINISNNNNAINNKNNTSYTSSGAACHGMPSATSRRGTKRKVSAGTISSAVRKRRKLQHSSKPGESRQEQVPQTKNTVAVLNELKRNLVYKVESQTGPVHAPLFTISVVVDGQKFVGSGPSKKLARVAAAASALRSFIQFKDGATLTPIEPLHNVDFTSDDPMIENSIFPLSDAGPGIQEKIITSSGPALPENITVNSNNTNSYSTSNSNISNNNCNSSSVYSNNSSSCKGNAKSIASSRQCDVGGLNSVTHSLNSSSNSVKVSAASNREPVANVRTEAGVGQDKQPPPQAPPKLLSVVPSLSSSSSASTSLPSSSLASSSSSSSASSLSPVAPDKQAAGCVDTSARTIAPAAASSIVTNIAATGTTYNDSYDQCVGARAGGTVLKSATTYFTLDYIPSLSSPSAAAPATASAAAAAAAAAADVAVAFPLIPITSTTTTNTQTTTTTTTNTTTFHSVTENNSSPATRNSDHSSTATIVMLPLAGCVVTPPPAVPPSSSSSVVKAVVGASPQGVDGSGTHDKNSNRTATTNSPTSYQAKATVKSTASTRMMNCTPSAAADFHRYVNCVPYEPFTVSNTPCITLGSAPVITAKSYSAGDAPAKNVASVCALSAGSVKVASNPVVNSAIAATAAAAATTAAALVIVTAPTSTLATGSTGGEPAKGTHESSARLSAAPAVATIPLCPPPPANHSSVYAPNAQNGHRQVVEKIQQSLDLFKNTNEKAVAWKKRFEKLKVSAGNLSRTSGNVIAGHHPKPQPEKGPVMLLHELFTDAHFECVSSDGLQHSKFTVVVTVNDNQRFEGTGPSKKMAKNAAAKAALASICNISFSPLQQSKFGLITSGASNGSIGGSNSVSVNGDNSFKQNKNFELPQTFADAVGKLVIEKFNEVMKGSDVYSRRKVLAGFVMTHGYDVKTAKVISLATGTKCVSGEHMSVTGSVINDSHAEIIARRGLMDFFYSQLDLLCQQTTSSAAVLTTTAVGGGLSAPPGAVVGTLSNGTTTAITSVTQSGDVADVEAVSEQKLATATPQAEVIFNKPSNESSLYTLKEGIYFHLYINTAPCGDARVFSPHENDSMDVDKHPNRKARGQLRTKVESGEGTIPVKSSDGIQTWDGVLQGQRLLTMSCSDKISRWNVLGLQGSMLASVIEPIYLHSIVLGSLLHPAHMYRAICGRIENAIQGLPPPYRLNKPKLALMTSAESRNQTKPPNFSINWITNSMEVEIVNSFTGKLINNNTNTNKMSRLSKQSFYRRYASIIARLPSVRLRHVKPTYFETKMSVNEYQQAKRELFAAFSKEDLGDWLKKPIEQDQFTLIVAKDSEPPSHVSQPQTVPTTSELNSLVSNAASTVGNCSK
uniref:A to I editase domain-containing protein n=1 Tax=Anopheles atroparvus TaxID=41427 RepID=A0AAG5DV91_ANOAO